MKLKLLLFLCVIFVRTQAQDEFPEPFPSVKGPIGKLVYICFRGGIGYDHLKAGGYGGVGNLHFQSNTSPCFSLGIDFDNKKALHGVIFRAECTYLPVDFKGTGTDPQSPNIQNTYHFKAHTFNSSVSILYNPINKESYGIYGGMGLGYTFSRAFEEDWKTKVGNEDAVNYDHVVPILPDHFFLNVSGGLLLDKKWEVALKVLFSAWTGIVDNSDLKNRTYYIGFGYRL